MKNQGKKICEELKSIRERVAAVNGIDYHATPCDYEGECPGTCPTCESELKYLNDRLKEKKERGEKISYNVQCSRKKYKSLVKEQEKNAIENHYAALIKYYEKEISARMVQKYDFPDKEFNSWGLISKNKWKGFPITAGIISIIGTYRIKTDEEYDYHESFYSSMKSQERDRISFL